jgi:predicted Zn-dependent protease
MQFMQFSRKAESEADYLGVQYLYKTGYDPGAAVSFFEKLQARETAKPGSVSKMFSTHPPTGDRIEATKKNIEVVLPDKDQYVVTTSEFQKIKGLLAQLENRRPANEDSNKPSLKRKTTRPTVEDDEEDPKETKTTKPEDQEPEPDERPTLKRRN